MHFEPVPKEYPRSSPGKWVVLTCFLLMALVFAPNNNLSGLFVVSLCEEFGATRTAVTSISTVGIIASMAGALLSGRLLMRFQMRTVMSSALSLVALCYFGMAFQADSIRDLYILAAIRGVCHAFLAMIPISILVREWFAETNRGLALGIVLTGNSVGAMIMSPPLSLLIELAGWRAGYFCFGFFAVAMIPLVFVTCIRPPDGAAGTLEQRVARLSRWSGTRLLLLALVFQLMLSGCVQTWNATGASFLGDIGLSAVRVGSVLSVTALGGILGKLTMGLLCDRRGPKSGVLAGILALFTGYCLLFVTGRLPWIAALPAFLLGFGVATANVAMPLIAATVTREGDYGASIGYMQFASSLGGGVLPLFMTRIYDRTSSFFPAWMVAAAMCAVLISLLPLLLKGVK